MMKRFRLYTSKDLSERQILLLEKPASQHLLRVLRARIGDPVAIFNGQGGEYRGKLIEEKRGEAVIELIQHVDVPCESPLVIHLLQGVSRGERMDYVIQKATELGVASITPLFTERSSVKLSEERLEKRLEHWRAIVISACEQSGRCRLPIIREALSLEKYLMNHQGEGFICDTETQHTLQEYPRLSAPVTLLIGPEGGFASHEIQQAKNRGFRSLSLGPRILRTETAPVVAIALLQSHGGDL